MPIFSTPVYSVPALPQTKQYVTSLDPVFVDHLSRHKDQQIAVMTTTGRVVGTLTGVAVDHIQLMYK
ncbi:DUF2642 domain-containing protein [Mesobacillus foraminis]|uniref:DUF2642 domain-containing protein n=1 Tax=Mesobacillus foraminis TaxID=279826 RepID=UPI0020354BFC|nr:DUF2642 domain-containing protein [Mesobacillus foraminis]